MTELELQLEEQARIAAAARAELLATQRTIDELRRVNGDLVAALKEAKDGEKYYREAFDARAKRERWLEVLALSYSRRDPWHEDDVKLSAALESVLGEVTKKLDECKERLSDSFGGMVKRAKLREEAVASGELK